MAVEMVDIEVGLPADPDGWRVDSDTSIRRASENESDQRRDDHYMKLVLAFDKAARDRRAFSFTRAGRMRRAAQVDHGMKRFAKEMAERMTAQVSEPEERKAARIHSYRALMLLLNELGARQEAVANSARIARRWSFGVFVVGCIVATGGLMAGGIVPLPF